MLTWLLLPLALAADPVEQRLTYDLSLGGQVVGHRDLTLRYLGSGPDEVHLVESWTEIQATIAGQLVVYRNRSTARLGRNRSSFTSSSDEAGRIVEVQGRLLPSDHWLLTVVDGEDLQSWDLRSTQVTVTTLDLVDPERSRVFQLTPAPAVLSTETGRILTGEVEDLGEATLVVGGQSVQVQRWALDGPEGRLELSWSSEGLLLAYGVDFLGLRLQAVARQLPAARSFGSIEGLHLGGGGTEEDL